VTLATASAAGLAVPVCCLVLADGHQVDAAVVQPLRTRGTVNASYPDQGSGAAAEDLPESSAGQVWATLR